MANKSLYHCESTLSQFLTAEPDTYLPGYCRLHNADGHIPKRFRMNGRILYDDEDKVDMTIHHDVQNKGLPPTIEKPTGFEKFKNTIAGLCDMEVICSLHFLAVVLLFIWSCLVALWSEVGLFGRPGNFPIRADVIFLFSGLLAFLLVFRNNQAYNRWYEGRTLWGKLTGDVIMLNQRVGCWVRDEAGILNTDDIRQCVARYSIAFLYATKALLRVEPLGEWDELTGIISPSEIERINKTDGWGPYYCLDLVRSALFHAAVQTIDEDSETAEFTMSNAREGNLESSLDRLSSHLAECIRIKNSCFPYSYGLLLQILTLLYLWALPVIAVDSVGWFVVPSSLLTSIFYISLLNIASDLEDPFGRDATDLTLDEFCTITEQQIFARYEASRTGDMYLRYLNHAIVEQDDAEWGGAALYESPVSARRPSMRRSNMGGGSGATGTRDDDSSSQASFDAINATPQDWAAYAAKQAEAHESTRQIGGGGEAAAADKSSEGKLLNKGAGGITMVNDQYQSDSDEEARISPDTPFKALKKIPSNRSNTSTPSLHSVHSMDKSDSFYQKANQGSSSGNKNKNNNNNNNNNNSSSSNNNNKREQPTPERRQPVQSASLTTTAAAATPATTGATSSSVPPLSRRNNSIQRGSTLSKKALQDSNSDDEEGDNNGSKLYPNAGAGIVDRIETKRPSWDQPPVAGTGTGAGTGLGKGRIPSSPTAASATARMLAATATTNTPAAATGEAQPTPNGAAGSAGSGSGGAAAGAELPRPHQVTTMSPPSVTPAVVAAAVEPTTSVEPTMSVEPAASIHQATLIEPAASVEPLQYPLPHQHHHPHELPEHEHEQEHAHLHPHVHTQQQMEHVGVHNHEHMQAINNTKHHHHPDHHPEHDGGRNYNYHISSESSDIDGLPALHVDSLSSSTATSPAHRSLAAGATAKSSIPTATVGRGEGNGSGGGGEENVSKTVALGHSSSSSSSSPPSSSLSPAPVMINPPTPFGAYPPPPAAAEERHHLITQLHPPEGRTTPELLPAGSLLDTHLDVADEGLELRVSEVLDFEGQDAFV